MRLGRWRAAVLSAAAILGFGAPSRAAPASNDLVLRRVLLSSGGVGLFEYEATVSGEADLPLEVRLDQVDDVLKSVVVYDDRGTAGAIRLPGQEAEGEIFRGLPFDESALESEAALLTALRGAEVEVTSPSGTIRGRILAVSEEPVAKGGVKHRLTLSSDAGVSSALLEDVVKLSFTDSHLQEQIDGALAALMEHKDRGTRTLLVHTEGEAERVVRVAFVAEVPLWKSTYRLTLPAASGSGRLQGWAMVENQSGHDWEGVDLTLASGNPVTFRQALYQAYYVDRPEIPVEVVGRVLPRLDEGAASVAEKHRGRLAPSAPMFAGEGAAPAPAERPMDLAPIAAAGATESATQVVLHLPEPITLASGEDALLPVIDATIPAERLSVYQPEVDATHPIASVELKNDRDTSLPPGAATVYEQGDDGATDYLGDARLATLPPGESRLVSFAVDQKVRVDAAQSTATALSLATVTGGVLRITRAERRTTTYTIQGAAREPRAVVLEHPRLEGWTLVEPAGARVEETESHYRVRAEVPAGQTTRVRVTLERPLAETVALADLPHEALAAYASSADLPDAVRAALERAASLRATFDEKAAAVDKLEAERGRIAAEQARIREDLKAVPAGNPLAERYVKMLGEQEDRLATLDADLDAARRDADTARKALAEYLRGLAL